MCDDLYRRKPDGGRWGVGACRFLPTRDLVRRGPRLGDHCRSDRWRPNARRPFDQAPHVPSGDRPPRPPTLGQLQHFAFRRHRLEVEGVLDPLPEPEVVERQDIEASESEDQQHLDGPPTDAADRHELADELVVAQRFRFVAGRHDAGLRLRRDVADRQDLVARETDASQNCFVDRQNVRRGRKRIRREQRKKAVEDGPGGLSLQLLVGDRPDQAFERRLMPCGRQAGTGRSRRSRRASPGWSRPDVQAPRGETPPRNVIIAAAVCGRKRSRVLVASALRQRRSTRPSGRAVGGSVGDPRNPVPARAVSV